jgi:hypothetical protein
MIFLKKEQRISLKNISRSVRRGLRDDCSFSWLCVLCASARNQNDTLLKKGKWIDIILLSLTFPKIF